MADYYYASERLFCTADSVTRAVRVRRHLYDGSLAPDTYFTVPANTRIAGRYVRGYASPDPDRGGALVFTAFSSKEELTMAVGDHIIDINGARVPFGLCETIVMAFSVYQNARRELRSRDVLTWTFECGTCGPVVVSRATKGTDVTWPNGHACAQLATKGGN